MTSALRDLLEALRPEEIPEVIAALSTRMAAELARRGVASSAAGAGPDENLSAQEAARRLGLSRDWLYRNAGELPFTVRIGRRLLFSARGLERWNRQRQGC